MEPTHEDFYRRLRSRVHSWLNQRGPKFRHAHLLLVAPDLFHLLCRLVADPRIPGADKAKLAGAIAYFVTPFDFMPDFMLGPFAFLDDIAVAAYALNSVINHGHGDVARELWAGDGDILEVIQGILAYTSNLFGEGVWKRLVSMFR